MVVVVVMRMVMGWGVMVVWEGPMVVVMVGMCEGRRVEVMVTMVMVMVSVQQVLPFIVYNVGLMPQVCSCSKMTMLSLLRERESDRVRVRKRTE